jgi:hypothetical protein
MHATPPCATRKKRKGHHRQRFLFLSFPFFSFLFAFFLLSFCFPVNYFPGGPIPALRASGISLGKRTALVVY